jgi:hypothetical protein
MHDVLADLAERLRTDIDRRVGQFAADVNASAAGLTAQSQAAALLGETLLAAVSRLGSAASLTEVLDIVGREAAALRPGAALFVMRNGAPEPWPSAVSATQTSEIAAQTEQLTMMVGGQVVAEIRFEPSRTDSTDRSAETDRSRMIALELLTRFAAQRLEVLTARRSAELMARQATGGQPLGAGDTSHSADDEAAKRYARLLVSEIRLYHEAAILEGRRARDLGSRLAGEIARARSLYNQRVGDSGHLTAYFRDELVRTLADGDSTLI